jgi:tRNA threonylcarbamoyladenosine biosynthesis protein TsaB
VRERGCAQPPRHAEDALRGPRPHLNGRVLVLATSGREAEVGLTLGAPEALVTRRVGAGAVRGRDLLPCVRDLLAAHGVAARALGGIAVDIGPGAFTGVRLGVTAAKALAFALGLPAVGVSSLVAQALGAPAADPVISVRDAGRGTLYATLLGPAPVGRPTERPTLRAAQRLEAHALRTWPTEAWLAGEEAPRLGDEHGLPQRCLEARADVAAVLALAWARLAAGSVPEAATLVPLYLQASAPERLLQGEAPPAPPSPAAGRPKAR